MLSNDQMQSVRNYLERTKEAILADIASKRQNFSGTFKIEVDQTGGSLLGPDYFKYLVIGRGPGKQPPIAPIEAWVKKYNITGKDKRGSFITDRSLAFAVAKKIARDGTNIFTGKKKGVDFLGAMEHAMPDLLKILARQESFKILTTFVKAVR